jgi:hypothetical protein
MTLRTAATLGLAGALLAGAVAAPAALGETKPKPKPITGSYQATATPDPTSTDVVSGDACVAPTVPTARFSHTFKVPARGTLFVDLQNQLDWSVAIRDGEGDRVASADGGSPEVKESTSVSFKKKQTVIIDTCNFLGEPTITVKYKFVYK